MEQTQLKACCGFSSSVVQFASSSEVARQCGNTLTLLNVQSLKQRLLTSGGHGIQGFCCNSKAGVVAVAEQGYKPNISIYRQSDLKQLQSLGADAEFTYTAIALSGDGELLAVCSGAPEKQLSIWHWRKAIKLAAAAVPHAISSISFHPADASVILTAPSALNPVKDSLSFSDHDNINQEQGVQLWQLENLWSRRELLSSPVQLPPGCVASCHAWAPEGIYIGCRDGTVLCLDPMSAVCHGKAHTSTGVISSVTVNKDAVAVASRSPAQIAFLQRAAPLFGDKQQQQAVPELQLIGSVVVSTEGCADVCFGGSIHKDLVVSTTDGSLLLLSRSASSQNPADVQIEPLADYHIGPITGVAAAPDNLHFISCGADSSVRAWALETGQLVGKRQLGGKLTCCATAVGSTGLAVSSKPVLAVGSELGVLRLLSLTDLQRLPVTHCCRLHTSAVTHVAFSPSCDHLLTAAAADKRVALLGIRGCEHADMLGYFATQEHILDICWYLSSTDGSAHILISTSDGSLTSLTPPVQAYTRDQQQHTGLDPAADVLQLSASALTAMSATAEVPLLRVAALPPSSRQTTVSDSGSSNSQHRTSTNIIGLGSDGQLHRLLLPDTNTDWANLKGRTLRSISKISLPAPGSALAVHPSGQSMVIACKDGSILTSPAASVAATAAAMAAVCSSTSSSGARTAGSGRVVAHGSKDTDGDAGVLAWSATGQWVASGARDGSLLLYAYTGLSQTQELPGVMQFDSSVVEDTEAPDDGTVPTLADAAAAAAALEAENAGAPVRQATLKTLQTIRNRLNEIRQANAAAPVEYRLSEAELVLDLQRLEKMRADVDAEVAKFIAEAEEKTQATEAKVQEIKSLCWDSMQTKGALCTGLKSGSKEVQNFPLPAQDESRWAKVANLRRTEIVRAAAEGLTPGSQLQDSNSRGSFAAAGTAQPGKDLNSMATHPSTNGISISGNADSSADFVSSAGASTRTCSTAGSIAASERESVRESMVTNATVAQQMLAKIGDCQASECKAEDLLYPELDVTYPGRKRMQAELYKRMVWELKTQFNKEFDQLVAQKHRDSDRLSDLASRMDDLIRELVQIHVLLNPSAASTQTSSGSAGQGELSATASAQASAGGAAADGLTAVSPGPSAVAARVSTVAAGSASCVGDVVSAEQLAADLAVGRLTAHWTPEEDLEDMLFNIKPGEVKAPKYQSAAERAKLAAEQAAAEEARRKAASDDATDRALKQMMGGKLERTVDEVADLVASRPAWMNDDPATFGEEQLKEYKEYCAKEQAAIEERLKRKAVMETELRTLKATADDIATKFDEAVAALAAKRVDLQIEVAALECRILRLLADYEVVTETAGYEAEQKAMAKLQTAQEQLAAVEQELTETQELQDQQQSALNSLQAEARAYDRALKSEFAETDSGSMSKLISLYKHRIAPATGDAAASKSSSGAASSGTAAVTLRPGSAAANSLSAELEFTSLSSTCKGAGAGQHDAAGGGAAAAASAAGAGSAAGGCDLFGPLGPAPVQVTVLSDAQMPESLELSVWERFLQYRIARGQMDITIRELSAKLACLHRQHELLLSRQTDKASQVTAAAEELEALRTKRAAAMFDVEVQLKLKQGQIECSPEGVSANNPDAVLISREQVVALNNAILAKGQAKLDLMKQMNEFKKGIYQLEWENRKIEMQAEDIISLTQQLQLLHVTKDFQQLVKASRNNKKAAPSSNTAAAGAGDNGGQSAAAIEVQRLEKLLQVREDLHKKAVAQKQRQLKQIEAQIAAKCRENASVALHLQGLEKLTEDQSRLEGAVAEDPGSDRLMRNLMMQRKLQDIAAAQAVEIAAAQAELEALQKRSFPSFPDQSSAGSCRLIPLAGPAAGSSNLHSTRSALPAVGRLAAPGRIMEGVVAAKHDVFAPPGSRKAIAKGDGFTARAIGPDAKISITPSQSATAAKTARLAAP